MEFSTIDAWIPVIDAGSVNGGYKLSVVPLGTGNAQPYGWLSSDGRMRRFTAG